MKGAKICIPPKDIFEKMWLLLIGFHFLTITGPASSKRQDAKSGQFPFAAGISTRWTPRANGALISRNLVLGAVLPEYENPDVVVKVFVGAIYFEKHADDRYREDCEVGRDNIFIHPEFDFRDIINDCAVIKLPKCIKLSKHVRPIHLLNRFSYDFRDPIHLISYGPLSKSKDGYPKKLGYVKTRTVPFHSCERFRPDITQIQNVCVTSAPGHCLCDGDKSALVVDYTHYRLPAIVAWGQLTDCDINLPLLCQSLHINLDWCAGKITNNTCSG